MSILIEKFNKAKQQYDIERNKEDGSKVMKSIAEVVNKLGVEWNVLNGGQLAELQIKLTGYQFYLADYVADLNRISEQLKLELKDIRANRWDEISETIKAERGKVKNKDEVENVLIVETKDIATEQILYETMFFKYKLKLAALRDIITATVQQIASKKQEIELSKLSE